MPYPPAEIHVDEALVRRLLERECPELAASSVRCVGEGWDNFMFVLDEAYAIRLPRREAAVVALKNEQRWLPHLPALPIAVPLPIHRGQASELFPWPWSVVQWVQGTTAESHRFTRRDVVLLAETLTALHQAAPADAPRNPFRGVPLRGKDARMQEALSGYAERSGLDITSCRSFWEKAIAEDESMEGRWLHGDLHPYNVLVRDGSMVGIIDWGDVAVGDVANDIACAWLLLDERRSRDEFLQAYGASTALRVRALGWALYIGLALAQSGEARHEALGSTIMSRVVADLQR